MLPQNQVAEKLLWIIVSHPLSGPSGAAVHVSGYGSGIPKGHVYPKSGIDVGKGDGRILPKLREKGQTKVRRYGTCRIPPIAQNQHHLGLGLLRWVTAVMSIEKVQFGDRRC